MARTRSTHNPRRCRAAGFTLLELLVVIGIIALITGMIVVGVSSTLSGAAARSTETRFEALQTMLVEYGRNTSGSVGAGATSTARQLPRSVLNVDYDGSNAVDLDDVMPPPDFNSLESFATTSHDPDNGAYNDATLTQQVLVRLLRVPSNQQAYDELPSDAKATQVTYDVKADFAFADTNESGDPDEGDRLEPGLILDGWDGLILWVPPNGMGSADGAPEAEWLAFDEGANPALTAAGVRVRARDGKGFFVSAGADGSFKNASDNLYSTDVAYYRVVNGAESLITD